MSKGRRDQEIVEVYRRGLSREETAKVLGLKVSDMQRRIERIISDLSLSEWLEIDIERSRNMHALENNDAGKASNQI